MTEEPRYAKFWDRFGAYILDALIVGLISYGINYLNFISLKSFYIYLPIALIAILYKPYMESRHQATLGKMALNLKVTNLNYEQIDFEKSLLRSLIVMIPALFFIPVQYLAFYNPNLLAIEGFWNFSKGVAETYPTMRTFNSIYSLVFIADLIFLLTDSSKRNRSLKDRIAKTLVLQK
ncbi:MULTISPECIES: RDD family protein [unclassified Arenibacter]|jgi:uncharacterized RDD family membrane protein YckC|uniref:RDD family protein n=1 Tax=unclassified Arenibacter TaxID=2615047 RepID=UPI000E346857|nr:MULTISPECIES: RDD family protein [unclassified Arenibacter]MCM4162403.1 hypothetical protein [Arenibacter sp. A80]RFT57998.1 RDD family protein [Arenibacter sp. P308M17]